MIAMILEGDLAEMTELESILEDAMVTVQMSQRDGSSVLGSTNITVLLNRLYGGCHKEMDPTYALGTQTSLLLMDAKEATVYVTKRDGSNLCA